MGLTLTQEVVVTHLSELGIDILVEPGDGLSIRGEGGNERLASMAPGNIVSV